MEEMKIDEKGNMEWYSRQSVQHERGMETGKQLSSSAWLAQEIPDEIAGSEI